MEQIYDIIVVGAGHAGCEAAAAAGNLGSKVLLITMDMTKIAQMSCNPAMGGIAKGQIIREIDALGGIAGIVTDKSMIQFRMLNKSKGPAMWSPRAQCDRTEFSMEWRKQLENIKNIDIWQDFVVKLLIENNKVKGVITKLGVTYRASAVILANGTFQNGLIHIGRTQQAGGRISEPASYGISEQLKELGFIVGRMKTGTPVRIDGRTIDFNILEEQKGDEEGGCFSYLSEREEVNKRNTRSCYITYTNSLVHRILEKGFKDSPLYNGTIKSIGPRYCPSIEDKIVTFASKNQHQLFIEPESNNNVEYYLNGFSSSLPLEIQFNALRKIKGLEKAKIFRPGYAIEYDFYDPKQLKLTLETKIIKGLFFAGQINGTTGYEEAGGQGIVAGINAHMLVHGEKEFILARDEAYIGVLIDDLITKGVDEPYRMFTSRAEYRIILRQDNADERLTEKSYKIGFAKNDRYNRLKIKRLNIERIYRYLNNTSVKPKQINSLLEKSNSSAISQSIRWKDILMRPQINLENAISIDKNLKGLIEKIELNKDEIKDLIEIEIKYEGYIKREKIIANKMNKLENLNISNNLDYTKIRSLSTEAKQKLKKIKPRTIGQASRISGVSPADINVLLVHLGR